MGVLARLLVCGVMPTAEEWGKFRERPPDGGASANELAAGVTDVSPLQRNRMGVARPDLENLFSAFSLVPINVASYIHCHQSIFSNSMLEKPKLKLGRHYQLNGT